MTGYVKLFQSILGSSVWAGPDAELRVWIAILALKDRQHVVRISAPGLATIARVSLEACRGALERFKGPDLDSTSKEYEGRKIRDLPEGGFLVLNGAKYAAMLSQEQRREYQRIKQAEYRKIKGGRKRQAQVEGRTQAVGEIVDEGNRKASEASLPVPEIKPGASREESRESEDDGVSLEPRSGDPEAEL